MNKSKTPQLSKSELQEMRDAKHQIAQAQRRIADILEKHLEVKVSEDLQPGAPILPAGKLINTEINTIKDGCCVIVGVYVDPPGICVPVN
jgi:hypothetical protein